MRKLFVVLAIVAGLTVIWLIAPLQAQTKKSVIFQSAENASYKDAVPGVSKAALWGDETKGAYGSFTKFVPGFDAGMHTHTNDLWIVVHKGAYVYKDGAGEKRVGPGSFLFIPGGWKHSSGGDKKEGALFYEESSGKFDLVPAK